MIVYNSQLIRTSQNIPDCVAATGGIVLECRFCPTLSQALSNLIFQKKIILQIQMFRYFLIFSDIIENRNMKTRFKKIISLYVNSTFNPSNL